MRTASIALQLHILIAQQFPEPLFPDVFKAGIAPSSSQPGLYHGDGAPDTLPSAARTWSRGGWSHNFVMMQTPTCIRRSEERKTLNFLQVINKRVQYF